MRLIDADALKEKAVDSDYAPTWKWLSLIDLESAPTIEPKRGKWRAIGNTFLAVCECGYITDKYSLYKYCPNCGAKMERSEE